MKSCGAPKPLYPIPSEKQYEYQKMEYIAFIHFGVNTFTDSEWGNGKEDISVFNPKKLNGDEWVKTLKEAGFKQVILTTKHHDGFCLWPSKYTDFSVKNTPFKDGKGDIVREVSDACKKYGLKFGIYLSPWDQNSSYYGRGQEYNEYYIKQLEELLENYGPIWELWLDGAKGSNVTQNYEREKWLNVVREKYPKAILWSDAGPDSRWCGNERGIAGEPMWTKATVRNMTVPHLDTDYLNHGDKNGEDWLPVECDVSIRPGWFYHEKEDNAVKSLEKLLEIYYKSVGRGCVLLLNVPPNQSGLIHENDKKALMELKKVIDETFREDLARKAQITASSTRGNGFEAFNLIDDNDNTYWATEDDVKEGCIELNFEEEKLFDVISIEEYVKLGQRVVKFNIQAKLKDEWKTIYEGETIGYKRLALFSPIKSSSIRINILESLACPVIQKVGVYKQPKYVEVGYKDENVKFNTEFKDDKVQVLEDIKKIELKVIRKERIDERLEVDYITEDGTARASIDYQQWSGTLCFDEGEAEKSIFINLIPNNEWKDKEFYVKLVNASANKNKVVVKFI